jgi:NTE family protein
MYGLLDSATLDQKNSKKFEDIKLEYHKIASERGAIIQKIIRIERKENAHFLFEDADFSLQTIKNLIHEGENDANAILKKSV